MLSAEENDVRAPPAGVEEQCEGMAGFAADRVALLVLARLFGPPGDVLRKETPAPDWPKSRPSRRRAPT
jgi:hypothetical protein